MTRSEMYDAVTRVLDDAKADPNDRMWVAGKVMGQAFADTMSKQFGEMSIKDGE